MNCYARNVKHMSIVFRENDLLKHQLRRYVNAVQMLRAEGTQDDNSMLTSCY